MVAIRVTRIFDGERLHPEGGVVTTAAGRIGEVRLGDHPSDLELVDGTLLPGLIDCHVHLCSDAGPQALERLAGADPAALGPTIDRSLRMHRQAGVTTVRDLGDLRGAVLSRPAHPNVIASGAPLTTPGGHTWFLGGEVRGREEIRQAVRDRATQGAHVVKIMASGGVFTPGSDTATTQFTDDELAAAVDEAHAQGLPITAHAHAHAAVWQALRAGVDGIEHCTSVTPSGAHVDGELADAVAASGIAVCPTLGSDPAVVVPPELLALAERAGLTQSALENGLGRLRTAGAKIIAGSDAGLGPAKPHGILPRTLEEYARSGLHPAEALAAATSRAADALRIADRKGRLRPGLDADLLLVPGNPAADITALRHPLQVLIAGVVLDREAQ